MIKFSAVYALEKEIVFRIGIQAPLEEAFDVLVKLGYDGVELHIPNPFEVEIGYLKNRISMYGLEVSAISTGLSYIKYGYSLSSKDHDIRLKAIEFFKKYGEIAYQLGSRIVVVGSARGKCEEDCEAAKQRLIDSLKTLGLHYKDLGVHIVLEPMNRKETDLLNKVAEAVNIINHVDNVYLLLDTYHLALEEGNVYEVLQKYGNYVKHIHVADTNRLPPGLGNLDWGQIAKVLKDIRYNNYVSVEALMEPNYVLALEIAIKTLKRSIA